MTKNHKNYLRSMKSRYIIASRGIHNDKIIVGHSIGALYALIVSKNLLNPPPGNRKNNIKAIVLINPITPFELDMKKKMKRQIYNTFISPKPRLGFGKLLAKLKLFRVFSSVPYKNVPGSIKNIVKNHYAIPNYYKSISAKLKILKKLIKDAKNSLPFLINIPITVITPHNDLLKKKLMAYQLPYEYVMQAVTLKDKTIKDLVKPFKNSKVIYSRKSNRELHFIEAMKIVKIIKGYIYKKF